MQCKYFILFYLFIIDHTKSVISGRLLHQDFCNIMTVNYSTYAYCTKLCIDCLISNKKDKKKLFSLSIIYYIGR